MVSSSELKTENRWAAWEPSMSWLKEQVNRVLKVVAPGSSIWYVDYPVHPNIGDLLIMLGTELFFEENGIRVLARYSMYNFPKRPRVPKGCIIVLHGGGSFGDIYEATELFRERVIAACRDNRVVVLPQTVHFRSQAAVERMASMLSTHRDLHVFVRDKVSFDFLKSVLSSTDVQMAPDMAHYLWPLLWDDQYDPQKPPLYLMRTDREQSVLASVPSIVGPRIDWPDLVSWRDWWLIGGLIRLQELLARLNTRSATSAWWRQRAVDLVNRAIALYRQHGTIITSRLHGHILACLMGHPTVLLDNSYGKNRAYFEAWTARVPFVSFSLSERADTSRSMRGPHDGAVSLTVAICTRDREQELARCVESVAAACRRVGGGVEVLVVDDGELREDCVERLRNTAQQAQARFRYYRKPAGERGLFRSRLEAIRRAQGDIILFLDDDVEIFPNYLELLTSRYQADASIVGIGGVDLFAGRGRWLISAFYRLFLLEGPRLGRLSASGFPDATYKWRHQHEAFETERLHGCNMSFRRFVLQHLEPGQWLDGYSVGEDLLLSWIARGAGKLLVDPALRVLHHASPASRDSREMVAASIVVNHFRLLQLYRAPLWRYLALGWSVMGLLLAAVLRGNVTNLKGYLSGIKTAIALWRRKGKPPIRYQTR